MSYACVTRNHGVVALKVLIVEKMKLLSEYYFAIVMDRAFKVRSLRVSLFRGTEMLDKDLGVTSVFGQLLCFQNS